MLIKEICSKWTIVEKKKNNNKQDRMENEIA